MVLRFYLHPDELIAEIHHDLPAIGQEVLLPDRDESYTVLHTVIDYRQWGNNYPTYANITVAKTSSIR